MRLTEKDTPLGLVKKYSNKDYKLMDGFKHGMMNRYPPECYVPITYGIKALTHMHSDSSPVQITSDATEFTGLYIWRKSKVMYLFDSTLAETLSEQVDDMKGEKLPIDFLLHLPYPCIYIKTDYWQERYFTRFSDGNAWDGFFAWIDWREHIKAFELQVLFVSETTCQSVPCYLRLTKPTLYECWDDTRAEFMLALDVAKKYGLEEEASREEYDALTFECLAVAVQMILYILSDNHDEEDDKEQKRIYRNARVRIKGREKPDEPAYIRLKNVGSGIGSALRKAQSDMPSETASACGKKQTHLRRGHWHHYWVGSKKNNERKLILKWVAPMIINPPKDGTDDIGISVYPVKPNLKEES